MTDDRIFEIARKWGMFASGIPQITGFAHDIRRSALEEVALQWDGCFYEGVAESIDIGAAIRALPQHQKGEP